MMNLNYLVWAFLCLVSVIYGLKDITGVVDCHNIMVFFVDGVLYKNGNIDTWDKSANVSIPGETQLVAIKCTYTRPVGIKMTLSNGFETSAAWKCSNKYQAGWNKRGFNDYNWNMAAVVNQEWIWTARKNEDVTVYCRKTLDDRADLKNITGVVDCHNIMKLYVDGVPYKNGNIDTWDKSANVNIPGDTQLVAIKCTYTGSVGIKMTLSNGFETSAEWKCNNEYQRGWNELGFNDDTWSNAVVVKHEWIWTAGNTDDETVYCRESLHARKVLDCLKFAGIAVGISASVTVIVIIISTVYLCRVRRKSTFIHVLLVSIIAIVFELVIGLMTYFLCDNVMDDGPIIGTDVAVCVFELILEVLVCTIGSRRKESNERSSKPSDVSPNEASHPTPSCQPPPYQLDPPVQPFFANQFHTLRLEVYEDGSDSSTQYNDSVSCRSSVDSVTSDL